MPQGYVARPSEGIASFFAGQGDPADPAHFTIRYITNGAEGLIDGNLQPDGKTVILAARGGGPLVEKE